MQLRAAMLMTPAISPNRRMRFASNQIKRNDRVRGFKKQHTTLTTHGATTKQRPAGLNIRCVRKFYSLS